MGDESVDLIRLDPPFNSNQNCNVLFKEKTLLHSDNGTIKIMGDLPTKLAEQLHEAQAKYVYFLLAAAASGIALAVQQTAGDALDWRHTTLGVAVVCWAVSFFAGCKNRAFFHSTLYANAALAQLQDGSYLERLPHPKQVEAACEGVRQAANENSASANAWGKLQFRALVAGALFFLAWHVSQMAILNAREDESAKVIDPVPHTVPTISGHAYDLCETNQTESVTAEFYVSELWNKKYPKT